MFARFQSAEEHEALVEGLLRARRLRQQIEIFQQYRSLGIKTLDQARHYELERRRREGDAKAKKQRDSSAYLFEKGGFGGGVEFGNSMSATGAGGGRRRGCAKCSAVEEDEASLQTQTPVLEAEGLHGPTQLPEVTGGPSRDCTPG